MSVEFGFELFDCCQHNRCISSKRCHSPTPVRTSGCYYTVGAEGMMLKLTLPS